MAASGYGKSRLSLIFCHSDITHSRCWRLSAQSRYTETDRSPWLSLGTSRHRSHDPCWLVAYARRTASLLFTFFLALGIADVFLRPRVSVVPPRKVDRSLLMNKVFLALCSIGLFSGPGFYVPIFYVPGECQKVHLELSASYIYRLCCQQTGT